MKPLVIIGAGGHARTVLSVLAADETWTAEGVVDIDYRGQRETIMGCPVIGGPEVLEEVDAEDLFLALGDNALRERWAGRLEGAGFAFPTLVSPRALVDPTAELGRGNLVAHFAYVGPMVRAGDFNIFNTASVVEHETRVGSFSHIAPNATLCGRCSAGSSVLLGAGAVAVPDVRIADRTRIGAQAAVVADIDRPGGVYTGIPAGRRP